MPAPGADEIVIKDHALRMVRKGLKRGVLEQESEEISKDSDLEHMTWIEVPVDEVCMLCPFPQIPTIRCQLRCCDFFDSWLGR